jgi:hypothetical protein
MAKKSGLASRFTLASEEITHRVIASGDGEVGTGKSYFGLTLPAPLVTFNIDQGLEGVVEKFREEGKEIYEEKYSWIPGDPEDEDDKNGDLQDLAKEIRGKFEKDIAYALNNGARSLVIDTESRFWQVFRYAEFGSPNAGNPRDYDELNQRFESFIHKVKASSDPVNLYLIRSMKDLWGAFGPANREGKKGFGKGGREAWGYEHLPGMMGMELSFLQLPKGNKLRAELEEEWGEGTCEYVIRFGKCRYNGSLAFTYTPRCEFPDVGVMLYPESDRSEWE